MVKQLGVDDRPTVTHRVLTLMPAEHGGFIVLEGDSMIRRTPDIPLFAGSIDDALMFVARFYRPPFVVDQKTPMPVDLEALRRGATTMTHVDREWDEGVAAAKARDAVEVVKAESSPALDRDRLVEKLQLADGPIQLTGLSMLWQDEARYLYRLVQRDIAENPTTWAQARGVAKDENPK